VDLDAAHSVRWARPASSERPLDIEALDLEILALIATMRHVLTTQIHRRFNPERAVTTTQRRLKRLSDAGLVGRFQFHRRDGGGVPMCYVIAPLGLELLGESGHLDSSGQRPGGRPRDPSSKSSSSPPLTAPTVASAKRVGGDRLLREARHDVHVTGWMLALESALGRSRLALWGPEESVLAPPQRSTVDGRTAIGPGDLQLPGGRTPHNFLRSDPTGGRVEVERFETVRPDASVEVSTGGIGACLLVELDDRLPSAAGAAKLERYDHLLAGWSVCTPRFAGRPSIARNGRVGPSPLVVFLCRDRPRARECARGADHVLSACRAYAGEYPREWEYPGRERIVFASERDIHEGVLLAYGVPRLPPEVRASDAPGDLSAREATCEARELLPGVLPR
jgi:Replication-relaxation